MRSKSFLYVLIGMLLSSPCLAMNVSTTLGKLAKNQGFFFFYSAGCPHCQRFAPTLKSLSAQHGFSVVAISVDGSFLPSFPDAVVDEGQKNIFDVKILPALFLVNPGDEKAVLVSEGNIERIELEGRLIKIATLLEQESLS